MRLDPAIAEADAERLSALGATFHDVWYVIRLEPDCGFEVLSDDVQQVLGYPADRLRNDPAFALSLLLPEDRGIWESLRTAPAGAVGSATLRWRSASGGIVSADVRCAKDVRADGSVALYGIARDVTARMATEQALRSAHERMRLLLENATDVVFDIAPNGTFRWVSPSVERVLGWRPADLVGTKTAPLVHPQDREATGIARDRPEQGVSRVPRFRIRTAAGRYRWMSGVARRMMTAEGSLLGWVAGLRDVDSEVRAEQALRASEEHFRLVAELGSDVVYRVGRDGRPQWVSPSVREILGWRPEELVGRDFAELVHPADQPALRAAVARILAGERTDAEIRLRTAAGPYRWLGLMGRPVRDPAGRVIGLIGGARDIQRGVDARRALERSESQFRQALESAPVGMAILDLERRFVQVNPALCRMLGRSAVWLGEHGMVDVLSPPDDAADRRLRAELLAGRRQAPTAEVRLLRADGEALWAEHSVGVLLDRDGTPQSYVSQFFDVTQARRAREQLAFLADHDVMTRLLSRHALLAAVARIDQHPPRTGTRMAALFIDVDRFKAVNDTYGHGVGDQVLSAVAGRIRAAARSDDLVARLGGDEIVVVLPNVHGLADAQAVATKIHDAMRSPVTVPGTALQVTVSIGAAVRDPGDDVEDVITKADRALYRAKRTGRRRTVAYDPELDGGSERPPPSGS